MPVHSPKVTPIFQIGFQFLIQIGRRFFRMCVVAIYLHGGCTAEALAAISYRERQIHADFHGYVRIEGRALFDVLRDDPVVLLPLSVAT